MFLSLGGSSSSLGGVIGGVIALIVVPCILIITIPLCICCYLNVGIGAVCRKGICTLRSTVVTGLPTTTTTTDVTTDTNICHSTANAPSPHSQPPAVPYPAHGYPQQTYPITGYSQENPSPYPLQSPRGYPPQQFAGCPPESYPPQQYANYPYEGYPPQQPPYSSETYPL